MQSDIIELQNKIESRNVLDRKHWAVKRRCKQIWALFIRNQMKLRKIREAEVGEKFTLTIVSYRIKLLDYDNLVGGCKQLIDALCHEGFIFDDAPKYLTTPTIKQIKSPTELTYLSREIIK